MKATLLYGARDVRIENVPDATIELPTDAVARVTRQHHDQRRPSPHGRRKRLSTE
jgi:hypothetical protein